MRLRAAGLLIFLATAVAAVSAPVIAPNLPAEQFLDYLYAPPMRVHVFDDGGRIRLPFVYPIALVDRLERWFEEDRTRVRTLVWFADGQLVQVANPANGPLFLLGADQLGRDVFSRLLRGARASLGVAVVAALLALLVGGLDGRSGR